MQFSDPFLVGITSLLINGRPVLLTDALKWAESELMGSYARLWPLTKLLDIGGVTRLPIVSRGTMGMSQLSFGKVVK